MPASLAYAPSHANTNADPFVLSPILGLPASFGSTYVGETFACTLCVNNEVVAPQPGATGWKRIRDVRIDAEMKTPLAGATHRLSLSSDAGIDLDPGETLQRVVSFQLKEKGTHVLAVTISYYEATDTSGRSRTFRKLYQFICKPALVVRTKVGPLPDLPAPDRSRPVRRWVLEAQLENCGDSPIRLEAVLLETEPGLLSKTLNWDCPAGAMVEVDDQELSRKDAHGSGLGNGGGRPAAKLPMVSRPVLHPGEVEQVCFVVSETVDVDHSHQPPSVTGESKERVVFGVMSVAWRGEMGSTGFLSTGKLGTRPSSRLPAG